jgi:hypothetical protein
MDQKVQDMMLQIRRMPDIITEDKTKPKKARKSRKWMSFASNEFML